MIDLTTLGNTTGSFPNIVGKNATSPSAQDGTPFIAAYIDNDWGWQQFIMDYAGLTPSGVTESSSVSQIVEAFQLAQGSGPGRGVIWWKNEAPSVTGDRVLLLTGQGVEIANYPELDANVWCTDAGPGGSPASGYNAIVAAGGGAFYRASDAAGTTPNIAGPYLILSDTRGRGLRGEDSGALVDPDGASRFLGGLQGSAMWGHWHKEYTGAPATNGNTGTPISFRSSNGASGGANMHVNQGGDVSDTIRESIDDGVNGTPTLASESRGANTQTRFGIIY
jgi:hypothetical protein